MEQERIAALQAGRIKAKQLGEERKAQGLPATKTPIEKAKEAPKSKALAIVAKCYECMGGSCSRNWRAEVGKCSSYECPLHPHRPYKEAKETASELNDNE